MIEYIDATSDFVNLLDTFIDKLGSSANSFRYFQKRPLSVLKNHLCTILLLKDGEPVCYGHLDKATNIVWLGIAVIEQETGKGFGKKMLEELIRRAKKLSLKSIYLAVDHSNYAAIGLYKKYGFREELKFTSYSRYILLLN